jgi:hypothetical protein
VVSKETPQSELPAIARCVKGSVGVKKLLLVLEMVRAGRLAPRVDTVCVCGRGRVGDEVDLVLCSQTVVCVLWLCVPRRTSQAA